MLNAEVSFQIQDKRNGKRIEYPAKYFDEDINKIAGTYHNWRNPNSDYEDIKGFCNSASVERVKELDYVLTPGRYVGLPDDEDDFDFNERFSQLKAELKEQMLKEEQLNKQILHNLKKVNLNENKHLTIDKIGNHKL